MTESIIVWAIVVIVLALLARSMYRRITGRKTGCGCGENSCPNSRFSDNNKPSI